MVKLKFLLWLSILLTAQGCFVNFHFINAYKNFNYQPTDSVYLKAYGQLNTKGFYCFKTIYMSDTLFEYYIFYDDGMIYTSVYNIDDDESEFKELLIKAQKSGLTKNYFNYGNGMIWGTYRVIGGKIKARICQSPGTQTLLVWDEHFTILDSNRIHYDGSCYLPCTSITKNEKKQILYFVPFDSIPNSDCWLKQKRWFWADKVAYKAYKKKLKEERKKK